MKDYSKIVRALKMGLEEVEQFYSAFPDAADPDVRRNGDTIKKELGIALEEQAPNELVADAVEQAASYLALRSRDLRAAGCPLTSWRLLKTAEEAMQCLVKPIEPVSPLSVELAQV